MGHSGREGGSETCERSLVALTGDVMGKPKRLRRFLLRRAPHRDLDHQRRVSPDQPRDLFFEKPKAVFVVRVRQKGQNTGSRDSNQFLFIESVANRAPRQLLHPPPRDVALDIADNGRCDAVDPVEWQPADLAVELGADCGGQFLGLAAKETPQPSARMIEAGPEREMQECDSGFRFGLPRLRGPDKRAQQGVLLIRIAAPIVQPIEKRDGISGWWRKLRYFPQRFELFDERVPVNDGFQRGAERGPG